MGVVYVVFWLVIIWSFVGSQHGGGMVSEPVEGTASSDTSLEGGAEILAMDRAN
jgi:hypothetical protein